MKLSIIIPTYNRVTFLERALKSVGRQKGEFEIVVIDDFSIDTTESFIRDYLQNHSHIIYIRQRKNRGVNAARNLAIKNAHGEWLAFLDDDDEFLPNAISTIQEKISHLPINFNVAYFNSIIDRGIDKIEGGFQFEEEKKFYDPTYEETMTKFNLKGDCKPVFRKSLFQNKKYMFPEQVNGFESYTMNIISKDKKGIRYFKEKTTLIHFDNSIQHISHTAPRKNPWPLFVLHAKQIPQHFWFYVRHPIFFTRKVWEMSKLFIRSLSISPV